MPRAGSQALDVLVGGPTAEEYDLRESAARDNRLIVPIALLVVFVILAALLRAITTPLVLIGTVIVSYFAALGIGAFFFENVFDFACQRAVLILRDVLGFSAKEAAESLDTTVASVNCALLRARRSVEERLPEPSQHATPWTLDDPRMREQVERFADAFERGEVDTILALLAKACPASARKSKRSQPAKGDHRANIRLRPIQARRHSGDDRACRRRSPMSGGSGRRGSSERTTPAPTSPAL